MDTPNEKGVTPRKGYLKVQEQMSITPPQLANEIKPEPHEETFFDMFFELYHPEMNFYTTLDAYCRVWDMELDGADITLLQMLWRTAENHRIKNQKEKIEKNKKSGSKGKAPSKPAHKPVKKRR